MENATTARTNQQKKTDPLQVLCMNALVGWCGNLCANITRKICIESNKLYHFWNLIPPHTSTRNYIWADAAKSFPAQTKWNNEHRALALALTHKLSVFDIREKQFRCWFFRNSSVYFTRRCLICLDFPSKTLSMCKIQIMETVFFFLLVFLHVILFCLLVRSAMWLHWKYSYKYIDGAQDAIRCSFHIFG